MKPLRDSTKILPNIGLTYDDVNLIPCKSSINSRTEVDISSKIGNINLSIPIISAPMDTVTNGVMTDVLGGIGGLGIIHRYQTVESRIEELKLASFDAPKGVAVGLEDSDVDIRILLFNGADLLCLDVAHAHHSKVIKAAERINKIVKDFGKSFMVGNVATYDAVAEYLNAGIDIIKVGIGGGSICTTRIITGFGVPNITAIMEAREAVDKFNPSAKIIADGGIKSSGDIAKALAAGAHAVMLGSLLAGTEETPGGIIWTEGGKSCPMKSYRGMASRDAQTGWKPLKAGTAPEGVATTVPCRGSVVPIIEELAGGLRSAFSYADAKNLEEFYENTQFIQVTANGTVEASAHIRNRNWG